MLRFFFLISALTFCAFTQAQSVQISGNVFDRSEQKPLAQVSVALLRVQDSMLVTYTRSNQLGAFNLSAPVAAQYIILVAYPGYADFADFIAADSDTLLPKIELLTKINLLENVVVRGSAIRMKGDTINYIADSFKVKAGSNVEDLLRRLPGLSVNGKGEITAQGQKVERVLVDGDEFFGDDPTLATRNIQAEAVKEVQVFDKKSDQATFTGVDDGQVQKTVNLKLKDEYKRGYFGKVQLGGGPERWESQTMLNAFKNKRKLSVYAISANSNNVSLGWSEDKQFGGGLDQRTEFGEDGSVMMWSEGDEFGGVGGYYGQGEPKGWSAGTSYANKWNQERSNVVAAYRWQKLNTQIQTTDYSQVLLADTQYVRNHANNSFQSRWRHKGSAKAEFFLDSSNAITAIIGGSFGQYGIENQTIAESYSFSGEIVNRNLITGYNNLDGKNADGKTNFLFKHKFKKRSRTLSINLGLSYSEKSSIGFLVTDNLSYFKDNLLKDTSINQKKDQYAYNRNYDLKLAYTEPVGKNGILELNMAHFLSQSHQRRLTYDGYDGKYDQINGFFSNDFQFDIRQNRSGLHYRYNDKKITFGIGSDMSFNRWEQQNLFANTKLPYQFTNFFPRSNFSYKLGQYSRIRANYNGTTKAPSPNQLQPVADNTNQQYISVGNPALVQSFSHRVDVSYHFWKVLSNTGFWLGINTNFVQHDFSESNYIDQEGKTVYQAINVGGNFNHQAYLGYDQKIKKLDISFAVQLNPQISRRTSLINGLENTTLNRHLEGSISLYRYKQDKYFAYLKPSVTYVHSTSTISQSVTYWMMAPELNFNFDLPKKWSVGSDMVYNWRQATPLFPNNNNALIWNGFINKKIHKKQDMKMGLQVRDLLNQQIGFSRNASSTMVTESTYNVIRRYWMITFNWNFSKGPQKVDTNDW